MSAYNSSKLEKTYYRHFQRQNPHKNLGGGAIHELLRKRAPEIDCLAIAFVITALVCYIVWLKKFKDKQKE